MDIQAGDVVRIRSGLGGRPMTVESVDHTFGGTADCVWHDGERPNRRSFGFHLLIISAKSDAARLRGGEEEGVEIQIGDQVRLKSGGPTMTVEFIDPTFGGTADCVWHDGKRSYRQTYGLATLVRVPPSDQPPFDSDPDRGNQLGSRRPHQTPAIVEPGSTNSKSLNIIKTPLRLFYSYSHRDEKLRQRLEEHLSLLQRQGIIAGWHDRKIGAGEEWNGTIDKNLEEAQIILLLVSSSFLASDYCWDVETKRAVDRHDRGEARVIPVILRPCDWHKAPFGKLQALPKDGKAVTSWKNRDEAWTAVAKGLRAVVEPLPAGPAEIIDSKTIDPSRPWSPRTTTTSDPPAEPPPTPDSVQRQLTQEDIENIRTQVWANCDSNGRSTARCPVDQFPMKITLHTFENRDADIAAFCKRHGLVTIEKTGDPLRPTFEGKTWTEAQVQDFAESVLRGQAVRCPICRTVIRSKEDGGFVILNCLRCGGHEVVPIR